MPDCRTKQKQAAATMNELLKKCENREEAE
jgi:hypothetical protein